MPGCSSVLGGRRHAVVPTSRCTSCGDPARLRARRAVTVSVIGCSAPLPCRRSSAPATGAYDQRGSTRMRDARSTPSTAGTPASLADRAATYRGRYDQAHFGSATSPRSSASPPRLPDAVGLTAWFTDNTQTAGHSGAMAPPICPPRRLARARARRRRRGQHRRADLDGAALRGLAGRRRPHRHQGGRRGQGQRARRRRAGHDAARLRRARGAAPDARHRPRRARAVPHRPRRRRGPGRRPDRRRRRLRDQAVLARGGGGPAARADAPRRRAAVARRSRCSRSAT